MSYSYTTTETWSRTHARYVAGKVAADLRQLQQEYGQPSDGEIEQFITELTVLMAGGYVAEASYGYRRGGEWVVALKYTADMNGTLSTDERSGKIPRGANVAAATFLSYLVFSSKWDKLTVGQRQAVENELPFRRTGASEPIVRLGSWLQDKTYSSAGSGMRRASVGGGN